MNEKIIQAFESKILLLKQIFDQNMDEEQFCIVIEDMRKCIFKSINLEKLMDNPLIIREKSLQRFVKLKDLQFSGKNKVCIIKDFDESNKLLEGFTGGHSFRLWPHMVLKEALPDSNEIEISALRKFDKLSYLIWVSLDFIISNLSDYIKNQELTSIEWFELIARLRFSDFRLKNIYSNQLFLLFCLLFESDIIKVILSDDCFKSKKESLNEAIINGLRDGFKSEAIIKVLLELIQKDSIERFFEIILICAYMGQFFKDKDHFSYKEFKKLAQAFVSLPDLTEFNSEDFFFLSAIGTDFLEELIGIRQAINLQRLGSENGEDSKIKPENKFFGRPISDIEFALENNFNFWKKIKSLETKIDLLEQEKHSKYALFPDIHPLDVISLLKKLSNLKFSYSALETFGITFFSNISNRTTSPYRLDNKRTKISEGEAEMLFAKERFCLESFKKNLFYLIEGEEYEYGLHLNFLENCFEIFRLWYDSEKMDLKSLKIDSFDDWVEIYKKILSPLDSHLNDAQERIRQFIFENKEYPRYLKMLDDNTIQQLKILTAKFKKFLLDHYPNWVSNKNNSDTPLNVANVMERLFLPKFLNDPGTFNLFLIIDCCRIETWDFLKKFVLVDFPDIQMKTNIGLSILPTSTKWARAALFSGTYPNEDFDTNEDKNFQKLLKQTGKATRISGLNPSFISKCENVFDFDILMRNFSNKNLDYQVAIFNFSDESSHSFDQSFVRSLLKSMYISRIRPLITKIMRNYKQFRVFFGTDHGISRATENWDWDDDDFNSYWEPTKKKFHEHLSNRFFISYKNLMKDKNELISLNNSAVIDRWGLKSQKGEQGLSYYFVGDFYNLQKTPNNKKILPRFMHGGYSPYEMIIPFAIFEKKDNQDIFNERISISILTDKTKPRLLINNNSNQDIQELNLKVFFKDYIFQFYYKVLKKGELWEFTLEQFDSKCPSLNCCLFFTVDERIYEIAQEFKITK